MTRRFQGMLTAPDRDGGLASKRSARSACKVVSPMAKQGMKRPEVGPKQKNDVPPVPELQGGAKRTKEKAKPITEK